MTRRAAVVLQQQAGRAVLSPTVHGLDISNHQSANIRSILDAHPEAEHVVVRIPLTVEPASLRPIAVAQCEQVLEYGKTLGGYVWCYGSVSPERTVYESAEFFDENGWRLPTLWLDLETYQPLAGPMDPGPDAPWLRTAFYHADSLGVRAGNYSALWWVSGYFPGGVPAFAEFKDRPLWVAQYDDTPTLESVFPTWHAFGFNVAGKQWRGYPLDQNVFRRDVTQ